jgi:hypothetical protein
MAQSANGENDNNNNNNNMNKLPISVVISDTKTLADEKVRFFGRYALILHGCG